MLMTFALTIKLRPLPAQLTYVYDSPWTRCALRNDCAYPSPLLPVTSTMVTSSSASSFWLLTPVARLNAMN